MTLYTQHTTYKLISPSSTIAQLRQQLEALPLPSYDEPGGWIQITIKRLQIERQLKRLGVRV